MEIKIRDLNVKIENIIFAKLIIDREFRNKALPILKEKYFNDITMKVIFRYINKLAEKCIAKIISPIIIINEAKQYEEWMKDVEEELKFNAFFDEILVSEITEEGKRNFLYNIDKEYALIETEKFAKERAFEGAILEAVVIMQDKKEKMGDVIKLMTDALAVGLPTEIGINFTKNPLERFKKYALNDERVPFRIPVLNEVSYGGFSKKTINLFMASTGIGKSLVMCSLAADYIMLGYNVLYVTLELSQSKICARIDANLLDIELKKLYKTPVEELSIKFNNFYTKNPNIGTLIVKELPTSTVDTSSVRLLLKELKTKEFFTPDIIFIDYLNLMNPYRTDNATNSYKTVKNTAEELRGIAVEYDCIVISATQTNRDGSGGVEVGLESVSESKGLPDTCDFFFGIYQTEVQRNENIMVVKILKSRDTEHVHKKFLLGIDYPHMRVFGLSNEQIEDIESTGKDIVNEDEEIENIRGRSNGKHKRA